MDKLNAFVGSRIRMYRQVKGYTLSELSQRIHKSKATISKYENGDITVDIQTLFDLASALDIRVGQLTDYLPEKSGRSSVPDYFFPQNEVYVYFYDGRSKRIVRSLLMLTHEGEFSSATLYNDLEDFSRPEECRFLYYGSVSYFDSITSFSLQNQSNRMEQVALCAFNPFDRSDRVSGMLTGISRHPMLPVSIRCLIAASPIPEDEALKESLLLSKEDLKRIRTMNMFAV